MLAKNLIFFPREAASLLRDFVNRFILSDMPEHVTVFHICSYTCLIPDTGYLHIEAIDR